MLWSKGEEEQEEQKERQRGRGKNKKKENKNRGREEGKRVGPHMNPRSPEGMRVLRICFQRRTGA